MPAFAPSRSLPCTRCSGRVLFDGRERACVNCGRFAEGPVPHKAPHRALGDPETQDSRSRARRAYRARQAAG